MDYSICGHLVTYMEKIILNPTSHQYINSSKWISEKQNFKKLEENVELFCFYLRVREVI